ncbi:family 16 glycosylhydrolase [Oceanispirochaeta sp.]|jgi:hypothetical protein|uniref:family 16 glycosylhydrolase n=1 Tax=Oceanispirochaeta sp. TaxID=2035350 RepID=UPI00262DD6BB|nr:family 16 glycosylhydrolase [Oceanispirochaeta sp.]MDA3955813.1 family 16 glycosylhydrolase [Oceanispirochaeta sp.]
MNKRILFFWGLFLVFSTFLASSDPGMIDFGGYQWQIKESDTATGPGPNIFSSKSVSSTPADRELEFSIRKKKGIVYSGEIFSDNYFGFGEFSIDFSLPDSWDSQLVFGFFLYNDKNPPHYNEIDFEISRWGMSQGDLFHFTVQPYEIKGNTHSFTPPPKGGRYTAQIIWRPDKIGFILKDNSMNILEGWTYQGESIPRNTESRIHMNLWLFQGKSPLEDGNMSVTIHNFSHTPFF